MKSNNKEFTNSFEFDSRKKKSVFKKIFDEIQSNDSDTDNSDSSGMIWKKIISPKKDLDLSVICLDDEPFAIENQNKLIENVDKFIEILKSNVVQTEINNKHFINGKILNLAELSSFQSREFEKISNKRKIQEGQLGDNRFLDTDKISEKKLQVFQETTNRTIYLRNRTTNQVTANTIKVLRFKGG
jgi:hypothetical protein